MPTPRKQTIADTPPQSDDVAVTATSVGATDTAANEIKATTMPPALVGVVPMPDHTDVARRTRLLAQIPAVWGNPPAELVSKLPKGGTTLDYMGHADVTLALINVDPLFDYGWLTNDDGTMMIQKKDNRFVLEGWVTVHGHTRRCVGTCETKKFEPEKELIGDLLRNGAMRFGVATALWSKAEMHDWAPIAPAVDPATQAAFDQLLAASAAMSDDEKALLRSWWKEQYGEIKVGVEAGIARLKAAATQAQAILDTTPVAAPMSVDGQLLEAFPGSEIVNGNGKV